jgi:hypothetical protein
LRDELRNRLVIAYGAAKVAVQHAFPVVEVLISQRSVEAIGVTSGRDVGSRSAFAEHLRDWIAGDEVDQQENQAYDQPDHGQRVEDALEDSLQGSVLRYIVILSAAGSNERAESKDPLPLDAASILSGGFGESGADRRHRGENALRRRERVAAA